MRGFSFFLLLFSVACLNADVAAAGSDSSYYKTYEDLVTGRFYFSRKYTSILVRDPSVTTELDYKPNTTLNMGIGATYRFFTLNLAYGFPFLNPDRGRGETEYLDLQAHFYGRKSNLDLFGQFYKGMYLVPKGLGRPDGNYYVRPDIKLREFGGSYQYVFNHSRYSFRSSFLQNEWQQRSAGTLLIGSEFFLGQTRADSSIFPTLDFQSDRPEINSIRFYEIGPNIGYAYTLVIARHFFITGSLTVAADYSMTEFSGPGRKAYAYGFNPNSMLRLFAGYNSDRNAFSLTFTNSRVNIDSKKNLSVSINTGNIRINYVRRFIPGEKTRRVLDRVFSGKE
ncbi:MAG: hypothetical protein RL021_1455 [Bacteroidota bacterium]|jgi:hypothetical protein